MFRPTFRLAVTSSRIASKPRLQHAQRFVSTAPPHKKSRSWKSSITRWGIAGGLVYWYSTATTFAEEPAYAVHAPHELPSENDALPTIDSIAAERRAQARSQTSAAGAPHSASTATGHEGAGIAVGSAAGLEEEAGQEGAFNEETGEINWDCPCLGGMAHGPCGEQFRAAFSCFVFSKEDPKGMDCIEHFKTMQNCFREHPDVYGSELEEEEVDSQLAAQDTDAASAQVTTSAPTNGTGETVAQSATDSTREEARQRSQDAAMQVKRDHSDVDDGLKQVPRAWHDTTDANTQNQ